LWRKFAKDERERADDVLNQFCYSLIYERSYKIAEILLTFGTKTLKQHGSEKTRRMMIVNLANAIRLQKREPEAIALLDREDWSASGEEFQLCVAAVKGEIDRVVELMKRMGASGSITREDYRNWPVFRGIRTNPKFGATFEAVFGVPFATPKQPVLEKAPASSSVH
jgi:hypothetical protein